MLAYESKAYDSGYNLVAGIDEVGRGPLAGPVVVAAVILPPELKSKTVYKKLSGIKDSKKLTPLQRERLYPVIRENALGIGIGVVDEKTIDQINILQATYRAMRQAIADLTPCPDYLLVDALTIPNISISQEAIKKGDSLSLSIAAASIIAKVIRDNWMEQLHEFYPQYNFVAHKGYGTSEHLAAIEEHGPSPIHRRSFRGVVFPTRTIRE